MQLGIVLATVATMAMPMGQTAADLTARTVDGHDSTVVAAPEKPGALLNATDVGEPMAEGPRLLVATAPAWTNQSALSSRVIGMGMLSGLEPGQVVLEYAKTLIGAPYIFGGNDVTVGFDCSRLTQWSYGQIGVQLPRTADQQGMVGVRVPMNQAKPGDLLHWPGHVALYVGPGLMIDASAPGTTVQVRPIWGNPEVRRIVDVDPSLGGHEVELPEAREYEVAEPVEPERKTDEEYVEAGVPDAAPADQGAPAPTAQQKAEQKPAASGTTATKPAASTPAASQSGESGTSSAGEQTATTTEEPAADEQPAEPTGAAQSGGSPKGPVDPDANAQSAGARLEDATPETVGAPVTAGVDEVQSAAN